MTHLKSGSTLLGGPRYFPRGQRQTQLRLLVHAAKGQGPRNLAEDAFVVFSRVVQGAVAGCCRAAASPSR